MTALANTIAFDCHFSMISSRFGLSDGSKYSLTLLAIFKLSMISLLIIGGTVAVQAIIVGFLKS